MFFVLTLHVRMFCQAKAAKVMLSEKVSTTVDHRMLGLFARIVAAQVQNR